MNGTNGSIVKSDDSIFWVSFFNKDKKLVAYALIPKSELNTRKDIIKNVDVWKTCES